MKTLNYKKLQIIVFSLSLVIIFVCFIYLANICSYADGNIDIVNQFNITSDDILNQQDFEESDDFVEGATNVYVNKSSYSYTNFSNYINNNSLSLPSSVNNNYADVYLQNTSFVFDTEYYRGDETSTLYVVPSNSFCSFESNQFYLYVPKQYILDNNLYNQNNEYYISRFLFLNGNYYNFSNVTFNTGDFTIDGSAYKKISLTAERNRVILSNLPIYYNGGSTILTLSGVDNINYSNLDSSSNSGENASNNLVFTSPDWTFKHNQYFAPYSKTIDTGSVYPYGTINFEFLPNEYQNTHSSQFTVNLIFEFDYSVTHTSGSGALASKTNDYYYFKYNNDGATSISVPLDDFITNGNQYSITFEEVFTNLKDSNRTLGGILLQNKEYDLTEYNKFNLYCYAKLVSGENSSGNYTEWYNPINKKGYTTDRNGETNKNPYSQEGVEDNSTSMNVPGDAGTNGDNSQTVGGGSSASASTGSITINNNINNSNNDLTSGGLISTILSLLGDNVSNGSESVESLAGVNGYVELANTTLSSVPSSLWMVIVTTFSAVVVITIIAFIISILFKIFF